jgi:hypothetical protein
MEKQGLAMKNIITIILSLLLTAGCTQESMYMHYALRAAGKNKSELKAVLRHYRTIDKDPEKLRAAKYLIANMPAHYSYRDTAAINSYYRKALEILGTGPSPDWQRDTLRQIGDREYAGLTRNIIPDVEVITADYLIYSIDRAFHEWRTRPWSRHLTYNEFQEWILPYKVTEQQSLDAWRDTLPAHYTDSISTVPPDDVQRNSISGAIEIVRGEIHSKQSAIGHRVIWEDRGSIPMRSAATWVRMTYGSCLDYVTMGTAVFRSVGLPAAVDQVPSWGRNSEGHSWYVFLSDRGREEPTINSLIIGAGMPFYTNERIPKVWRTTYTINRDMVKYRNTAKYVYPFDLCQKDVTNHYTRTSDLVIETAKEQTAKLTDKKFVYIAMAVNSGGPQWRVLDLGILKRGKAHFKNMGREMLYIALGYDGRKLIPISRPFILHKSGAIEYIDNPDESYAKTISMDLRRKYYENYNVVNMRRRILGGKIQCSDRPDFKDAVTLYTIENTEIPYYLELNASRSYRYWRYLPADGTYGSVAELMFYGKDGDKLTGTPIANPEALERRIKRAFDGDLLSNFESDQKNGNWVGMDMGKPIEVTRATVIPRSDDNDISPGSEYELFCFDGQKWSSLGYQRAEDNILHYDNIPFNTLLWLRDYTRGNNERPFIVKENGDIEWW